MKFLIAKFLDSAKMLTSTNEREIEMEYKFQIININNGEKFSEYEKEDRANYVCTVLNERNHTSTYKVRVSVIGG